MAPPPEQCSSLCLHTSATWSAESGSPPSALHLTVPLGPPRIVPNTGGLVFLRDVVFFFFCFLPLEPTSGEEGIYFVANVKKVLEVWQLPKQEYMYIVEAEVLTGNSTPGQRGLVVPPVLDTNPARRYHSVSAGPDVSVIFDRRQALPTKIITCKL